MKTTQTLFSTIFLLLSIHSCHGLTPKEHFLLGYQADIEAAEAFQVILYVEDLQHRAKAYESPFGLSNLLIGTIQSYGAQPLGIQTYFNNLKSRLLSPPPPQLPFHTHILNILEEEHERAFDPLEEANKKALDHYQNAKAENRGSSQNMFFPANLFAEAGEMLIVPETGQIAEESDEDRQSKLPLLVATLAHLGLAGVPQNAFVAFIWTYRSAMKGNREAAFHFTSKLLTENGVNTSMTIGRCELDTFSPQLPNLIPPLNTHVGGHENVFRLCSFAACFLLDHIVLLPLYSFYLGLDYGQWVHILSCFTGGLFQTALLEHYLKHRYSYPYEELRRMAIKNPTSLTKTIEDNKILLTPSACNQLVNSAQEGLRTWALGTYECELHDYHHFLSTQKSRSYESSGDEEDNESGDSDGDDQTT